MKAPLSVLVLGLSLSSSWGNGHATTYRALLRGLSKLGHRIHFVERDVPWYADNRDLTDPDYCKLSFYTDLADLNRRFGRLIASADVVIVGSYVPDGRDVVDIILDRASGIVAFYDIDTPVTCAKLETDAAAYLAVRQVPHFDLYLSFSGGPILRYVERRFGAKRAEPLYCAVDEDQYYPEAAGAWRWDLGYLGTYSADRQPMVERLLIEPARRLPDMRFVIAGPQYPVDIAWPENVERIEHLGPAEHKAFYNGLRFTLNVTRADMVAAGWSPSVRLFEAAACGTPIISDCWDGLSSFLPDGDAIVMARSSNDVVAALTQITDAGRQRIANEARRRVLRSHTGTARAQELERHLLSVCTAQSREKRAGLIREGADEVFVPE